MRQQQGARPTSGKRHWVSARGRGHDSRSKPRALLQPPEPALCARLGPHCSPALGSGPLPGPPRWPGLQTQGTRPPSVGTVSRPRTVPGDSCGSAPQAASWAHRFAVGSRGAVELAADCGSEGRTVAGRPRLSQSAARAPHSAGAGSGLGLTLSLRFRVQERGSPPLVFPQVCGEVQAGLGGSRLTLPPPAATAGRHKVSLLGNAQPDGGAPSWRGPGLPLVGGEEGVTVGEWQHEAEETGNLWAGRRPCPQAGPRLAPRALPPPNRSHGVLCDRVGYTDITLPSPSEEGGHRALLSRPPSV